MGMGMEDVDSVFARGRPRTTAGWPPVVLDDLTVDDDFEFGLYATSTPTQSRRRARGLSSVQHFEARREDRGRARGSGFH